MNIRTLTLLAATALFGATLVASPASAASADTASAPPNEYGYVYANDPTAASYAPLAAYQRNSRGATNRIERLTKGMYRVRFTNLGTNDGSAGYYAHASAEEPAALCNTFSIALNLTGDVLVDVYCFDGAGQPYDGRFSAFFVRQFTQVSGYGFTRTFNQHLDGHFASPGFSHPSPLPPWIERKGVGRYSVRLSVMAAAGGNVLAAAVGNQPKFCTAGNWQSHEPNAYVDVSCFDLTGAPADTPFSVLFTRGPSIVGGTQPRAYLWAGQASAQQPYHPGPQWAMNSTGGEMTVTRGSKGVYSVKLAGLGAAGGHMQVVAQTTEPRRCASTTWQSFGADMYAEVRCVDLVGEWADTPFDLFFVR